MLHVFSCHVEKYSWWYNLLTLLKHNFSSFFQSVCFWVQDYFFLSFFFSGCHLVSNYHSLVCHELRRIVTLPLIYSSLMQMAFSSWVWKQVAASSVPPTDNIGVIRKCPIFSKMVESENRFCLHSIHQSFMSIFIKEVLNVIHIILSKFKRKQ